MLVKLLKSFPLEKKFPAPVRATIVVFSSTAASFSNLFQKLLVKFVKLAFEMQRTTSTKSMYIWVVIAFFLPGLLSLIILNLPSIVTS